MKTVLIHYVVNDIEGVMPKTIFHNSFFIQHKLEESITIVQIVKAINEREKDNLKEDSYEASLINIINI